MLAALLVPLAVNEELKKLKYEAHRLRGEIPERSVLVKWIWKKAELSGKANKSLLDKIQKSGLLDEKLLELDDEDFILLLLILLASIE